MTASHDDGSHDAVQAWERVRARLRAEFGDNTFNSWMKPLALQQGQGAQVVLEAPTRFMRDWVFNHYADRIREFWRAERADVRDVDIVVRKAGTRAATQPQALANGTAGHGMGSHGSGGNGLARATMMPAATGDEFADIGAQLDPRYTFDTFVVGKSNELAYAAARRIADAQEVAFNPFYMFGGVGLGKTHLLHAIAWHVKTKRPDRRVVYLSAEKFMYQFIKAVRTKDQVQFKESFRSVDILMIDDIQFIAGKTSTQEEFFHTFNALIDLNRQIVLTGDRPPTDIEGIEARLSSRLGWGLVADIHTSDYELRLAILQTKAEKSKCKAIPAKVLEFLAHRITSNIRELEGALTRLIAYSQFVGRPITLESTQELLQDLLRANDRRVTIDEIQRKVAEHFNIKLADMSSPRRARAVARPRQVAMYLCKQLTSRSLPEIGRKFGGRDHTTVMHAVKKIEELRGSDSTFAEDLDLLKRMLEG